MKNFCRLLIHGIILFLILNTQPIISQALEDVWSPDNGDGTYKNPIIFADYSDPDVIRVDDDFYMVASSFSQFPGIPVLHSKDLINWKIIGHVTCDYPFDEFKKPQHGKGIWAPSLRYHKGEYFVYFGDPDHGILMSKTKDPSGPWEPLKLIKEAKGWIDPCPLWDDDGSAYLVHAWAKSRAGFNSILTINKMSPDGKSILDQVVNVFNGHENQPTIEGPKFYKRNNYYYIFAPAGGVKPGWQTVLRSKSIYGPYEDKVVLEQGTTNINGPHQGGWVELKSGESWFIHFQDKNAYGRVVHLNPVKWIADWPVMGIDNDGNGIGEPVEVYNKPDVGKEYQIVNPQTNDDFNSEKLGLQWQWEAIPNNDWYSLKENKGYLRLYSQQVDADFRNLRELPYIVAQKLPAGEFSFNTKLVVGNSNDSMRTGIIVLGQDYCSIELLTTENGNELRQIICYDADKGKPEKIIQSIIFTAKEIYLKIYLNEEAVCTFAYSVDGNDYKVIGNDFISKAGRWVGAKVGLFSITYSSSSYKIYSDFDWVKFGKQ